MRNRTLDLVKLYSAIMVIFIHIPFAGQAGIIFDALARFAVPLFFMVSGYFCYSNNKEVVKRKIPQKTLHILKIFIVAGLLYCAWQCCKYHNIQDIISWLVGNLNIKTIIGFVFLNNIFFGAHLWYLWALIYSYVLFYIVNEYDLYKIAYGSIPILLGIHLVLGEGLSMIGITVNIILVRNFLLFGFPFFMLGNYIHKNEEIIHKKLNSNILLLSLVGGGYGLIIIERLLIAKNELYLGAVIVACVLFVYAINNKEAEVNQGLADIGASCTLFIYVMHPMIGGICGKIAIGLRFDDEMIWGAVKPLVVCVLSVIGAMIFNKIININRIHKNNVKAKLMRKL